jgi:chromodomain-helicase-DNA-binding protein 4
MQTGKKKLVLDHLIVQKMDDDDTAGGDLQSILTFGANALFEDGDQASKDITCMYRIALIEQISDSPFFRPRG